MIAATECPVKPIQSSVEMEKPHIEDTAYTTLHDNNPSDGDQHDGDAGNVAATPQQIDNLRAIVKNEVPPDEQDDPPDDDVETQHSDHPPLSSEDNNDASDQQRATPYSGGGDYQQQHSEQIMSAHNSSIDENHRDAPVKFEQHSNALGGSQDTHSTTASSADEPSTTIPHTANMDDTNSGGAGGVEDQSPNTSPQSTSNTISIRRLFVGGLPRTATEDMLIEHFSVYGPIEAVLVPRDPQTGRTRGFGFVTFVELGSANAALKNPQIMNGREIDCKLAFPKDTLFPSATDIQKKNHGTIYQTNKVFIGGLNTTTQSAALRKYFDQYGTITSCRVVRDRDSNESRRFGFVEFEGSSAVDEVIRRSEHHMVDGKYVQVKRCIPQSRMHASSGVDYHGDYMHNMSDSHHSEHSNHQHHGAEPSNPYMRHNNPQPINTIHHPQENPQYLPPMSEYRNHPGAAGGPMIMSNDIQRNNSMSVYGYPCRGGMTLSSGIPGGGLLIHPPVSTGGGPPPPSLRNSMCGHYDADQMRGLYRRPNMGDSNAISGSPYNSSGENQPLNRYNEVPQTTMDMRVGGIRPPAGRSAYSDHSAGASAASYGGMMGPPDDGNCGCLDCYMNKGSPHNYGTSATGIGATRRDSMSPLSRSHTGSRGFHSNNYSTGGPQRRQPGVEVYDNRQPQNSPSYAPQRMIATSPNQPPSLYTSPYHCRPQGQSPAFHHHHLQEGPAHPGQEVYGSGGSALGGEMSTYGMSEVYHHGPGGYSQNEPTSPRGGKVGHMDDGPDVNRHRWTSSERNDSSYPYGERPSSRFEYEVGNEMMVPSGIPGGPPPSSFAPPRGMPADDYRINSRSSNEFRQDYSEHNHSHHNNRFRPVRDGATVPMMYEGMMDVRSGQPVHSAVNYITRRPNNRAVVVDQQQQPPQSPSGGNPSPHNQYHQRSDHEFEGSMSMAPPTPSQDNSGYVVLDSGSSSAADHEQQRRQLSPTGTRWSTAEGESGGRKRRSHGYTRSSSSPRHDDNNLEGEGNSSSEYRDDVRRYHENMSPNNNLESCCEDNSSPPSRKLRRYEGGSSPPPPPCDNNTTDTVDEMEDGGHHHHHHHHSTTNEIDDSSCVTSGAEEDSSVCVNNNIGS